MGRQIIILLLLALTCSAQFNFRDPAFLAAAVPKVSSAPATYASVYPPAQSTTWVKATTDQGEVYRPHFATDPTTSLTGSVANNAWLANWTAVDQRFHIDLGGTTNAVKRVYYENYHQSGILSDFGPLNFTLWGSTSGAAFAELTYGTDTDWVQLTVGQATLAAHVASDTPDPRYVYVTNSTAYRYYAFKFADCQGAASWMGIRRIELQVLQ